MSGGSATHAGIGFQDKVAGWLAVHILSDEPIQFLGLPMGVKPVSIEMETSAPVDDILISTSDGGFCFVNVKRSITLTRDPTSFLASVLDQFVRQWIACESTQGIAGRTWQRPLKPNRDRLVLITDRARSNRFVDSFSKVLQRLTDRGSMTPLDSLAKTNIESETLAGVLELLRIITRRHLGDDPTEQFLTSLLSLIRVIAVDPDGVNKTNALALLRTSVIFEQSDAERSWLQLVSECQRLAETRSGTDRAGLRKALAASEIRLRDVVEIESDLRQLKNITLDTFESMKHLARLEVPADTGTVSVEISRAVTHALVEHAIQTSMLVIGAPGAGKSGALYAAAKHLHENGYPVVAIAVDQYSASNLDELRRQLQLSHSVIDVLRNWTTSQPGILFIDALDASRGGPSDRAFQDLIRRMIRDVPNWHVVASIREFDLRFGVVYRDLFAGQPVNQAYRHDDFNNVQHLLVPKLDHEELAIVWAASPLMERAYREGTDALRKLLRSPFNLFLLANVLSDGSDELGGVTTQIQLLHLYWSHRVIGNDLRGIARDNLLHKSLDQMLEGRILRVPFSNIQGAEAEDLYKLNSNGVLAPVQGVEDRVQRVAFAHHVLFDYGIARLVLEGGEAPDFSKRLTHSDERALFIAPGATMALQMLWQGDTGQRDQFWQQSLTIAAAEGSGAFCRMLPARVAASLTDAIEEWNPIFQCLQGSDCAERKAAIFLVRHCTGALSAGISPMHLRDSQLGLWPQIARRLSEIAVADVGWMLKPLISEWVERPASLDEREREDICAAARLILRQGSGEQYEIGMVIIGIQAVARTLKIAPEASIQSLYQLLAPEHVHAYGHKELFWLAQELKYLLPLSSLTGKLIGDIYRAGYCTPLPSSEEVTSIFDSRIVGMTSNKRQDFESARYLLQQVFPRFLESDPVIATEAFVDAAKCTMEETERDVGDVIPMMVGDVLTGYQPDNSYISYRQRDAYSLFGAFESGLRSLADGGRADALADIVATVVAKNHLACVWTALLRMGSFKPETLGRLLVPLSCAAPVLEGLDTRKPAGDLIKALHPLLESSERVVIERAILNTNERTKAILLGCLDERNIELPEALHERESLAQGGGLPENRAPFVVSGFAQGADDWWLREKGVDLTADANLALNQAIKSVQRIKAENGSAEQSDTIANKWGEVQALRKVLQSDEAIPEALRMSAWDAIAEAAETAALSCKEGEEFEAFPGIKEIVFDAAASGHWPRGEENHQEAEEAFARGPSWGSPAPRIAAAGAAMALLWAEKAPDEQLAQLILASARDLSPAVRHQILCRTNMLFASDKPLMMDLCKIGLQQEENVGVLGFFLAAIQPILQEQPTWFAEHLVALDERFPSTE